MNIVTASIEVIDMPPYDMTLKKIERIGRVCYKSESRIAEDSAEKFVAGILRRGHESVIEHESISVKVICDRGISHEIVRHRIASYSQESTRYCNYSKDQFQSQISVIDIATGFNYDLDKPEDLRKYAIWEEAMGAAEYYYSMMMEAGATPQEARSVLPTSTKTEIVMTMNLREWRHFLKLRTVGTAHPQIQEIARMILAAFKHEMPVFFADIED